MVRTGNCDGDRRQVMNFLSVYATPRFSNQRLQIVARQLADLGIVRFQPAVATSR
jgi:hypothetical protein